MYTYNMRSAQRITGALEAKARHLNETVSFSPRPHYLDYKVGKENKDPSEIPF